MWDGIRRRSSMEMSSTAKDFDFDGAMLILGLNFRRTLNMLSAVLYAASPPRALVTKDMHTRGVINVIATCSEVP